VEKVEKVENVEKVKKVNKDDENFQSLRDGIIIVDKVEKIFNPGGMTIL
jgi:hypothetical protein